MVKIYVKYILIGKITLDDVPEKYKKDVQALLESEV